MTQPSVGKLLVNMDADIPEKLEAVMQHFGTTNKSEAVRQCIRRAWNEIPD
jgi:metal-responsive CopG/Arc/MetJ family transcriptional regulator